MSPRITTLLRLGLPAAVLAILAITAVVTIPSAQRPPLIDDSVQVLKNPPSVNPPSVNPPSVNPPYNNATLSSPESGALPEFNFGAAGDLGDNSNSGDTARNMADHGVELAILFGDLSYGSGSSEINSWWEKDIAPLHGISVAVLGNHDDTSSSMMNQYHSLFELSDKDPNNDWIFSFN